MARLLRVQVWHRLKWVKVMQFSRLKSSIAAVGVALAVCSTPAAAATVLNVNWGEGCGKTTCFGDDGVYTKSFSAGDFSGPVTIGQLLMQRGVLGSLDGLTFRISFSLNGEEVGTWGHYNMSGIGGEELSFAGENFVWNPEDGDLVLTLALPPPLKFGGGGVFFGAPQQFGQGPGDGGAGAGDPFGEGLGDEGPGQDGPNGPGPLIGPAAIPEPAAWTMMITGFGLAGATLRRRRSIIAG